MADIVDQINRINAREIGSIRPAIQSDGVSLDWEDDDLVQVLLSGPRPTYPRYSANNEEQEKRFAAACNELSKLATDCKPPEDIELLADKLAVDFDEEHQQRLRYHSWHCCDVSRQRKGLLLLGEGGIGKTRFLFELVELMVEEGQSFVVAFSNAALGEIVSFEPSELEASFPEGIVIIVDAANERDEELVSRLLGRIPEIQKSPVLRIIVSTRQGAPVSYEEELSDVLLFRYEFPGVNNISVVSELSQHGAAIFFQFQEMLLGNNPRNILATKRAIERMGEEGKGLQATTERTKIIEDCVKEQMSKERWTDTKKICGYLYSNKADSFTRDEINGVLAGKVDVYLREMMSAGFIRSYVDRDNQDVFFFSSESQMNILVSRSLLKDLDKGLFDENDLAGSAERVAAIVASKAFGANSHEMCQVAIDKFSKKGPMFFVELLAAFREAKIYFDEMKIIKETVFPGETDFSQIRDRVNADAGQAFLEFAGYLNCPLNLMNYSHALLCDCPDLVNDAFFGKWRTYELSDLIQRVKNISYYVSYNGLLTPAAVGEWCWLAIWSCASTNGNIRTWALRLLRAIVDREPDAVDILMNAWEIVPFAFVRRAISKTIAESCKSARSRPGVIDFSRGILEDESVVDYEVNLNSCKILGVSLTEASARDFVVELGTNSPTAAELESLKDLVVELDSLFPHYFPFEAMKYHSGVFEMSIGGRYLAVEKSRVFVWNKAFNSALNCPESCPCSGDMIFWNDGNSVVSIPFDREELDSEALGNAFNQLVIRAYEANGGSVAERLGAGDRGWARGDFLFDPDYRPVNEALGAFMGSLSINYYKDSIEIRPAKTALSGFSPKDDWHRYDKDKEIAFTQPRFSEDMAAIRRKIAKRVEGPAGKDPSWFDDLEGAKEDLLSILEPLKYKGIRWFPLAVDVRSYVRSPHEIESSNEALVCFAMSNAPKLTGDGDRVHTIEHDTIVGHVEELENSNILECLEAPLPEYAIDDGFSFKMYFPPIELMRRHGLIYKRDEGAFYRAGDKAPIIICDGNSRGYFEDKVSALVLAREDFHEEIVDNGEIKFYAFTERYVPKRGYGGNVDAHWEFLPDGTVLSLFGNDGREPSRRIMPVECKGCCFSEDSREAWYADDGGDELADWLKSINDSVE